MKFPKDMTLEQAFILGYETAWAEATEVVPEEVDGSLDAGLPDGYELPAWLGGHGQANGEWLKLRKGDEIVQNNIGGTWTVDSSRKLTGVRWKTIAEASETSDNKPDFERIEV